MIIHKSKNPLHLQLYNIADTTGRVNTNFCLYSRKVVYGFLFSCLIVGFCVLASLMVLEPILATIMWAFSDYGFQTFFNPSWAGGIWFIDVIVALCVIVAYIGHLIHKGWKKLMAIPSKPLEPYEPGFVRTWIKSIHDKTCFIIEIKD